MTGAKPVQTLLPTSPSITLRSGTLLDDPINFRMVIGGQYLSLTRPDISFAVGNKDDFSSTSAFIVYLGKNPISWSLKNQHTIARSSTEVKYRLVAATVTELNWVCSLLTDLGLPLSTTLVIYCDNVGATQLCSNPIFHLQMKHVAIDFHFIRDQVQSSSLRVAHVSSKDQLTDALTKPLSQVIFQSLNDKNGLSCCGLS
ncbi:hypothetical protein LWI28_013747 [Acer negundo]|uniref:Retrovirus-related Pol polyprotein from transposon RE2 n=1 Tax=Acer negundo TaxID=4023 RepID=A0AAD5IMC3_ACENE|nr:hypothetical protein LWI28_013747 [Acer negundo]